MKHLLRTQWSLSVTSRLLLALLPSLLAVAMVAGLVYWGEYGRQAPAAVLSASIVLAALALGLTVLNVRYLVQRFDRITELVAAEAARRAPSTRTGISDEFDRIEQVVDHLGTALTKSESERLAAHEMSAVRLSEQSTLLAALVRDTMARLDDVRMPLHILLETGFGALNENQEELLRDARKAADELDEALRRMGQVADADRDAMPVQREFVQVNDVLRAILPLIRASADRRGVRVDALLEPGLPRVTADRARLAEALSLLAVVTVVMGDDGDTMSVMSQRAGTGVDVALHPWRSAEPQDLRVALALRLLTAQGATAEAAGEMLTVHIARADTERRN